MLTSLTGPIGWAPFVSDHQSLLDCQAVGAGIDDEDEDGADAPISVGKASVPGASKVRLMERERGLG